MATTPKFVDDFDSNSLDMWNNLGDENYMERFKEKYHPEPKVREKRIDRNELIRLRDKSANLIEVAKTEMEKFGKEGKYFKANEMRFAGVIHTNLLNSLNNLLEGKPVF